SSQRNSDIPGTGGWIRQAHLAAKANACGKQGSASHRFKANPRTTTGVAQRTTFRADYHRTLALLVHTLSQIKRTPFNTPHTRGAFHKCHDNTRGPNRCSVENTLLKAIMASCNS